MDSHARLDLRLSRHVDGAEQRLHHLQARIRPVGQDAVELRDEHPHMGRGDREVRVRILGLETNLIEVRDRARILQLLKLNAEHAARHRLFRQRRVLALERKDRLESLGKGGKAVGDEIGWIAPRRTRHLSARPLDGDPHDLLGLERLGGVFLGAGFGIIAHQHLIGGEFAFDGAGAVSLKHARPIGKEAVLDLAVAKIGDAHAGRRQYQHHRVAEEGLGAERQRRQDGAPRVDA